MLNTTIIQSSINYFSKKKKYKKYSKHRELVGIKFNLFCII